MKLQLFVILALGLIIFGCDCEHSDSTCYHGTVIMSSCCTGTTFIELDAATPIGKSTQLMGQEFKNVIQVPGYLDEGEIFLNLRAFRTEEEALAWLTED